MLAEIGKTRRSRYDGQAGPEGEAALLHRRRLAHKPLANTQSDGGLAGNELRRYILRFVVSLGVVIMILLLTAPKGIS